MSSELQGWVRPRPLRIAFLVQDSDNSDVMLDGIFADCYRRWGGRFSLLVPCTENLIPIQYWPWLESYDPDVVVSYVAMSREAVIEIHEQLHPAEYISVPERVRGSDRPLGLHDFKPQYDFGSPLESLSTIFRAARSRSPFDSGPELQLLDCWHTDRASRFFLDNFGTLHDSRGNSFYPRDAAAVMGLVHVVSPEKKDDRQYGVPQDLETVPNEIEAFQGFAEDRFIGLAQLSAMFAPKLEIRMHPWGGSFNLVIGDTYEDRLLFWNARQLIPAWLDSSLSCFRVTMDQLRDPVFRPIFVSMLNKKNQVNHGSGGQSQLAIRSLSCEQGQLEEAQGLLADEKVWSAISLHRLESIDEVVPDCEALFQAREGSRYGSSNQRKPDWVPFVWTPPTARPPHVPPDHLEDAPPNHAFSRGYFAVDYSFEINDSNATSQWSNSPQWVLPRRWRMAGAFSVSHGENVRHQPILPPRSSRDGNLVNLVSNELTIESIQIPSVGDAIRYALVEDGRRYGAPGSDYPYPEAKVAWAHASNEARYLTGILGLTGGLQGAVSFLLHPFLRDMFARLGGSTKLAAQTVEPTLNKLRKRTRSKSNFDLDDPKDVETLANLVVWTARSLKSSNSYVCYEDLVSDWADYRQKFWERNDKPKSVGAEESDFERIEEESLDLCLIEMRARKILLQGHHWICPKCHHRNWEDMSQLTPQLTCSVCGDMKDAPVSVRWLFRPNTFVIDALRDHSILSLIWALAKIGSGPHRSFMFVGPRWYGYQNNMRSEERRSPDAETDLIVLLDGQVLLCEVKATWRQLKSSDLPDLVALAKRLRPDVVILAVMEESAVPLDKLEAAREELCAESIEFRVLTREPNGDLYDSPHLM